MASAGGTAVLDPQTMVRDELLAALPHLRRLPDRIDRILTLTGRGDLRLRHVVDEDSRRLLRTLVNRALLAAVGAAFLFAATALLVAPDAGPDRRQLDRPVRDLRLRRPARRLGAPAAGRRRSGPGRHDMTIDERRPS